MARKPKPHRLVIINCIFEAVYKWSLPNITGQSPPPRCSFSLTSVGERRAALFGGRQSGLAISDDLFVVELRRDTVVKIVNNL